MNIETLIFGSIVPGHFCVVTRSGLGTMLVVRWVQCILNYPTISMLLNFNVPMYFVSVYIFTCIIIICTNTHTHTLRLSKQQIYNGEAKVDLCCPMDV